jgi:oxygen-independent coproporphyrinogen-3 oxidase
VNSSIPENEYINILIQQLEHFSNFVGKRTLTSIFFGGGTPSLMSPNSVEKLILAAQSKFAFSSNIEITLEANPTSSSHEKLKNFIQAGINRFSIGVQGLDAEKLSFLGREHSADEAIQTVENTLKLCGNVNLDLIYGLPNQGLAEWQKQLTWAVGVGTHHISAYQLTIEQNTAFYSLYRRGELTMPSQDIQADFYEATTEILGQNGYQHYEISNYSKPNHQCQHNLHIWKYQEYLGLGAGAHGRVRSLTGQLHATQGKKLPQAFMAPYTHITQTLAVDDILSPDEIAVENILMSLRTEAGINKRAFEQHCGFTLDQAIHGGEKQRLLQLGILHETPDHLVLNKNYWSILDNVCVNLIK